MVTRFVVMVRDPQAVGGPDPEYTVVSEPLEQDAAYEARNRYAAELRRQMARPGDVQVVLARWDVFDTPAPYRPVTVFRVSS